MLNIVSYSLIYKPNAFWISRIKALNLAILLNGNKRFELNLLSFFFLVVMLKLVSTRMITCRKSIIKVTGPIDNRMFDKKS